MARSQVDSSRQPRPPVHADQGLEIDASHYGALFDQSAEAMLLLNAEGQVVAVNERACLLFGRAESELVARGVRELTDSSDDRVHALVAKRRRTGHAKSGLTIRRTDGRAIETEVTSTCFHDTGGALLSYVVLRDVSERQAAEQALLASEHRHRALIETTGSVLIGIAPDGKVIEWNREAERLFGYARHEVLGRDYFALIADTSCREAMRTEVARTMVGEARRPREDTIVSRQGDVRVVLWSLTRLLDVSSRPLGVIASGQDISERKQLEAQMQHAQKLESLGVLAGGIAHDFNNLLVGILGNASLALMDVPGESELHDMLRDIETAALRAADLTKQMLAYSGRGRFAVRPLELSGLVAEMAHLLHTVISKRATLHFDFADGAPLVEADATQLRQIVMNLITNASDALNGENGTITLRTGTVWCDGDTRRSPFLDYDLTEGHYAFVEVIDSGMGMTPETMQRIFDPFFSTKFTGRGLGLAATLGIVRGHRGTIDVESVPGRGTTFRVLLPIADPGAPDGGSPHAHDEGVRGHGLVLVVDDDPTVCAVARQMLERRGFRVRIAADGLDGLDHFHRERDAIRLALIDLTMPRMGGEELVAAIRAVDRDIPIILMSGFNDAEVAERFPPHWVSACVQKPFRVEELDQVIRKTEERHGSRLAL